MSTMHCLILSSFPTSLLKLVFELRECAEFGRADRREICWMREQDGPASLDELVEVHVAMGSFGLEVWRCSQSQYLHSCSY